MKKIKAIVKDEYTLELIEDAFKGDIIDLKELMEVDTTLIKEAIELKKDKVYQELVNNALKNVKLDYEKTLLEEKNKTDKVILGLQNEIKSLKDNQQSVVNENAYKVEKKFTDEVNDLKNQLALKNNQLDNLSKSIEETINLKVMEAENKLKENYVREIERLKKQFDILKTVSESNTKVQVLEKEKELTSQHAQEIEQYKKQLELEHMEVERLKNLKSSLNIKQIGNNLEDWCDERIRELMQNGLYNCKWIPDHEVVKDEDEKKGSKADYIFKVFANEKCNPDEEIASICLDMKDEDPSSTIKQTNEHYYKALDKNRIKKNCKYAVLVSNLELDRPDPLPIFKVREYENMYVVRPAYLTSFINMVVSLSSRYQDLILKNETEMVQLKKQEEILLEFNKIKLTYLDKPLDGLKTKVNTISEQTEAIKKANNKIKEACDKIIDDYIDNIIKKINNFEIKVKKLG